MKTILKNGTKDNVATLLIDANQGDKFIVEDKEIVALQSIPYGHKIALCDIKKGESVIKYNEVIATAGCDISKGSHVHVHNCETVRGAVKK